MSFAWALQSDSGRIRDQNEDNARVVPELGLFIVADGMGGHIAGEVASRVAADSFAAAVASQPAPSLVRDQPEVLRQAILAANDAVVSEAAALGLQGMGTTLTALRITRRTATVCHVGDTRAYFVRPKHLAALTEDHTLVAVLVAAGIVSADAAQLHPDRHLLTQALGTQLQIEPQLLQKRIPRDARILLCSDGLHDHVPPQELHEKALLPELTEAALALVRAANERGGPDNITVLLVDP